MRKRSQRRFPHGELVVVPNATHALPIEQPETVARLIESFIAKTK